MVGLARQTAAVFDAFALEQSVRFRWDAFRNNRARTMITILPFADPHWPFLWAMMQPVFRAGETYAYAPDITEPEARRLWVEAPTATFVAVDEQKNVTGTYFIKPNQPGLGDHVCNCGYIVSESAKGRGVASALCTHSQRQAMDLGFLAMQYNLVVSTNERAVRLWQRLGFDIIGTVPQAFRHARLGLVDAHIMYKRLMPQTLDSEPQ